MGVPPPPGFNPSNRLLIAYIMQIWYAPTGYEEYLFIYLYLYRIYAFRRAGINGGRVK